METRDIDEKEYGTLTQYLTTKGSWANWSRTLNGITFLIHPNKKTVDYFLAFKAAGIELRLNVMIDRIEVQGTDNLLPSDFEPISDIHEDIILNWLSDVGMKGKERALQSISQSAAKNRYHPVKRYLDSLEWDGQDWIGVLFSMLEFQNQEMAQTLFSRWLIGSVAKIYENAQNFMLVLDGRQGIGKSRLARSLCPLDKYFIEGAVHPDDKDSYKRLISSWIWEVGELEGTTRKADRAALKDFISKVWVTMRVPYGKHDIIKPAAASLIGTINEDGAGFLNDPTGNRRYVILKLNDVNFYYSEIMDMGQLWAQVMHLYQAGEDWELTQAEKLIQTNTNKEYAATSPVEELLKQHYTWGDLVPENFIPTIEILGELRLAGLNGNDRANLMEISTILSGSRLAKSRQNGLRGFIGIAKKTQKAEIPLNLPT